MHGIISHYYQLVQSISVLRVVRLYFSFLSKFQWNFLQANSGDPDPIPHSVVSDLGWHCLSMPHKKDDRLKCVKQFITIFIY